MMKNLALALIGALAFVAVECSLVRAAQVTLEALDFKGTWKFQAVGVTIPVKLTSHQVFTKAAMTAGLSPNGSLMLIISYGEILSITMPGETCLRFAATKQVGKKRLSGILKLQGADCKTDLGEEAPFRAWKTRG